MKMNLKQFQFQKTPFYPIINLVYPILYFSSIFIIRFFVNKPLTRNTVLTKSRPCSIFRLSTAYLKTSDNFYKLKHTKYYSDKSVDLHKRSDKRKNNTDYRNTGKDTYKESEYRADHDEDDKLDNERYHVTGLDLKGSGPKSL